MPGLVRTLRRAWGLVAVLPLIGAALAEEAPALPGSDSTADHSKLEALKGPFTSGPEVTKACLSCHTEAGDQVMHTIHWTWDYSHPVTGQILGKKNVINSFCGNVSVNETRCTSCHAGYGWEDTRVAAPADPTRVDCLACHDRSGQYSKLDNKAGNPPLFPVAPKAKTITGKDAVVVDLAKAARSVGMPGRDNCGSCHFYGGGGDNVKHGDLSSALISPALSTDVHMSPDGENFTCESCHVSNRHALAGSRYNVVAKDEADPHLLGQRRDVATCESCHSNRPHSVTPVGMKLNDHTDRVACQTCHIPEFARGGVATKTLWDWSTAGKLRNGKPFAEEDFTQSDGKHLHTYLSTKGSFEWGENVVPYYAWFNGQVEYTLPGETFDLDGPLEVNRIGGSASDPGARIWPFKRMVGKQAFDPELKTLLFNHVYGPETDTAFWTNFDWDKSIAAAMSYVGQPYSGKFEFVDTVMYWPIAHMVAPADQALACESCHARAGRLAGIQGIHIPGTGLPPGGLAGLVLLGLAALGVVGHGFLRVVARAGGQSGKGGDHG
ncbi:tetrathionate reductase family octaheme c-type cytochrome [Rhodobacter sp. Har01]|uniref:tetrathionate reductase family octaheme c-type cytochrome n=1 Tax=Rhodobacter sp. Har01 TaxID=2883999 RepID=UPI001D07C9A9|nr:tetrathionate reductase family octaheme c-type cytochrome [Rhodobacter sp. Har01]MCB6178085.1 tetrathionate reductase family octaheme c-type cytochrome [Rhodobacter sp. Har01]